jgi:hypothetical protein
MIKSGGTLARIMRVLVLGGAAIMVIDRWNLRLLGHRGEYNGRVILSP